MDATTDKAAQAQDGAANPLFPLSPKAVRQLLDRAAALRIDCAGDHLPVLRRAAD